MWPLPGAQLWSQKSVTALFFGESMTEINWTSELKKIEREFDGLPPEPSPSVLRTRRGAEQLAAQRREELDIALGASVRLLLVIALGVAIIYWPFARACGSGLVAYLGSAAVVVLGGLWSVAWTWRARIGSAHALAMVVTLWGIALGAAEVLPRIGYARPDPLHPAMLWCPGTNPAALFNRGRTR
jgi:hypothetical protein